MNDVIKVINDKLNKKKNFVMFSSKFHMFKIERSKIKTVS